MLSILKSEINKIVRKDVFLLCFIVPFIYLFLLPSIYYNKRIENINIGAVDENKTNISMELIRNINATQNTHIVKIFQSKENAQKEMNEGKIAAYIFIPKDFSNNIKNFKDTKSLIFVDASNIVVSNPIIQSFSDVILYSSNKQLKNILEHSVYNTQKAESLSEPIRFDIRVLFNKNLNYSTFMLIGLILVVMQQILLVSITYSIVDDRSKNIFVNFKNFNQYFFGKGIPYIAINLIITCISLPIILAIFGIDISLLTLLKASAILLFFYLCLLSFGFLISNFLATRFSIFVFFMFYSMPVFFLSGFLWPFSAFPFFIKALSFVFPSTIVLDSFRFLILADVPFSYMFPTVLKLLFMSIIFFIISALLMNKLHYKMKDI